MSDLLKGIRVIEMGTHVPVPKAARLLAEWGADVIKVENPHGDPYRSAIPALWGMPATDGNAPIWENENSNKRDICLDLKQPAALEAMHKLLAGADIFLCNTRPKSLVKMGLDHDTLKQRYPRLICAYFSGSGQEGPDKDRPGFDVTAFWARSGALTEWCFEEAGPFKPTPGFGDGATGAMLLSGVLAALYHREKTGKGDRISTSLFGAALWYNSTGIVFGQPQFHMARPVSRNKNQLPTGPLYKSKDGDYFMLTFDNYAKDMPKILQAIGLSPYWEDPRFKDAPTARANCDTLIPLFDARFAELGTQELVENLRALDINFSKLSTIYDLYKDEQAWANDYIYEQTMAGGGKVVLPRTPVHFASSPDLPKNLAPLLGEHTGEILRDLGYTDEQIAGLAESKAVVCHGQQ